MTGATSETELANLALDTIGARATITSLSESSNAAAAVARRFGRCRDRLLRAAHWNFARYQMQLPLLIDGTQPGPPKPPQPWVYEYGLPQDCLQARYVMPMADVVPGTVPGTVTTPPFLTQPVRFLISSDNDGSGQPQTVLLTNQPQAILVYTRQVTNVALWDATFLDAFISLLASSICMTLTGDRGRMEDQFKVAQDLVVQAQSRNGNEGITSQDYTPDWMRVRGYASDFAYPDGGVFLYGPQALTLVS